MGFKISEILFERIETFSKTTISIPIFDVLIRKCYDYELIEQSIYYIHNWQLQSFSQDYGLASKTTHVMCVNFIYEQRDLQYFLNSTLNDRFLRFFSWQF